VLATDLQAHACVQLGQVKRGLALLQRAASMAEAFGFDAHRGAIEISSASYEARFGLRGLAHTLQQLELLQSEQRQDSYSSRVVALDRAMLLALAGRGDTALSLLREFDRILVPEGDRRMQLRTLLTAATVAMLRDGHAAAKPLITRAEQLLDDGWDAALRVEVLCVKAFCAAPGDQEPLAQELDRAARHTGIARAALYAHLLDRTRPLPESVRLHDFEDDRLGALLLSVLHEQRVPRLIHEGYLGLIPRALGLSPGRRIYLLEPARLAIENHGHVCFERPGETTLRLLRALSDGQWWSKEQLLAMVWGLTGYRPDRHDAVVYTAVARTRQALGLCREWLETEQGAYRLNGPECRVVPWRDGSLAEVEDDAADADSSEAPLALGESDSSEPSPAAAFVREHGSATTGRLAKALQVSEMTALRELQKLVARGVLRRVGRGRSTRYEAIEVLT
jgi:hypothetical protein